MISSLGGGAVFGPGARPPVESLLSMPPELRLFLEGLENWAFANEKDAGRDKMRFWLLKLPAILLTSTSGVVAVLHLATYITALASALGAVCIALDGALKPGKLYGVHISAFHDIRNLANAVTSEWAAGVLQSKDPSTLGAEIIKRAERQRAAIAASLKKEEGRGL